MRFRILECAGLISGELFFMDRGELAKEEEVVEDKETRVFLFASRFFFYETLHA